MSTERPTPETALREEIARYEPDGAQYSDLALERVCRMVAPLLDEVDALRAQVERVREALFASDDGTEYEHDRDHGQAEGYPDCPGCWVETIRRALDGEATP